MTGIEKLPLEQGFRGAVEVYWSRLLKFAKVVCISLVVGSILALAWMFIGRNSLAAGYATVGLLMATCAAVVVALTYAQYQIKGHIEMSLAIANAQIEKRLASVRSNDVEISRILRESRVVLFHSVSSGHGVGLFFSEKIRIEVKKQLFYRDMPLTDSIIMEINVTRGGLDLEAVERLADIDNLIVAAEDALRSGKQAGRSQAPR